MFATESLPRHGREARKKSSLPSGNRRANYGGADCADYARPFLLRCDELDGVDPNPRSGTGTSYGRSPEHLAHVGLEVQ